MWQWRAVTPLSLTLSETQMARSARRFFRRNTAVKRQQIRPVNKGKHRDRNLRGPRPQATQTLEVTNVITCGERIKVSAGMRFEIESFQPAHPSTLQPTHRQNEIWIQVHTKRSPEMKQPQIITAFQVHVRLVKGLAFRKIAYMAKLLSEVGAQWQPAKVK